MLELAETSLNITMNFGGLHGNKGFEQTDTPRFHKVYVTDISPEREIKDESAPSGNVPINITYGLKIPVVTVTGYFPYKFPSPEFDAYLNYLKPGRIVSTPKYIFLVGTILTVQSNSGFNDMPMGSKWYVKKYTWKRNMSHPDRGEFNLVLLRWYKGD